ncbi:outer membrane beta-barrel protein [Vibrio sp. 10N.261.51.F12]|uniref:outer membrane beta-barrel protein n=1 Tax=Vibrio sp. 10N.261.51.F12 TaxID=3229679 RepID=UPI0035539E12
MKKTLLTIALLSASSFSFADDNSGFRIGAGVAGGFEQHDSNKAIAAPKIELGYDMNSMLSFNAGYTHLSGDSSIAGEKSDISGGALNLGVEVGHTFDLSNHKLKPYVGLDYKFQSVENKIADISDRERSHSAVPSVGVRWTAPVGFYTDAKVSYHKSTDYVKSDAVAGLTVGWKF